MAFTASKGSPETSFSDTYKQQIFSQWYQAGKPGANKLYPQLEGLDPYTGCKLAKSTLAGWISKDFHDWAVPLDEEVRNNLENSLVAEKVKMLERHAETGKKMQALGIQYLEENGVGGSRNAIQLLVEGLRIERESVGAPKFNVQMSEMTDEQLVEKVKDMLMLAPITEQTPIGDDE